MSDPETSVGKVTKRNIHKLDGLWMYDITLGYVPVWDEPDKPEFVQPSDDSDTSFISSGECDESDIHFTPIVWF